MIDAAGWGQGFENEIWENEIALETYALDVYGFNTLSLGPILHPDFYYTASLQILEFSPHFYEIQNPPTPLNYYAASQEVAPQTGSPVDAINWGTVLAGANELGTLIIPVYFQPFSQNFVTDFWGEYDARDWTDHELGQFRIAFDMIESFIDVQFVEVFIPEEAVFHLSVFRGSPFLTPAGAMFPPEFGDTPGFGFFNRRVSIWDENGEGGLLEGGAGFEVIIHELGHGLGLAHPHDDGGTSSVLNGVDGDPQNNTGDYGLNQAVFTIMSYVDGWAEGPNGESPSTSFGWAGSFSPLDIAHLQALYGANPDTGSGDTIYMLPASNAEGTFFSAIWDVGGNDTIMSNTSEGAVINLNAATLRYEIGGGGSVSYNLSILGGFTIAAGVVIENALGGLGADFLIGNAVGNLLNGGAGDDRLFGGLGADELIGGTGNDRLHGGADDDELSGQGGADIFVFSGGAGNDQILDFENGVDRIELGDGAYQFSDLQMAQVGDDVVIKSSNGTITLAGINIADMDEGDFIFRLSADIEPSKAAKDTLIASLHIDIYLARSTEQSSIDLFLAAQPSLFADLQDENFYQYFNPQFADAGFLL